MALKTYSVYTRCEVCGVYDRDAHWCDLCGRPKDGSRGPRPAPDPDPPSRPVVRERPPVSKPAAAPPSSRVPDGKDLPRNTARRGAAPEQPSLFEEEPEARDAKGPARAHRKLKESGAAGTGRSKAAPASRTAKKAPAKKKGAGAKASAVKGSGAKASATKGAKKTATKKAARARGGQVRQQRGAAPQQGRSRGRAQAKPAQGRRKPKAGRKRS